MALLRRSWPSRPPWPVDGRGPAKTRWRRARQRCASGGPRRWVIFASSGGRLRRPGSSRVVLNSHGPAAPGLGPPGASGPRRNPDARRRDLPVVSIFRLDFVSIFRFSIQAHEFRPLPPPSPVPRHITNIPVSERRYITQIAAQDLSKWNRFHSPPRPRSVGGRPPPPLPSQPLSCRMLVCSRRGPEDDGGAAAQGRTQAAPRLVVGARRRDALPRGPAGREPLGASPLGGIEPAPFRRGGGARRTSGGAVGPAVSQRGAERKPPGPGSAEGMSTGVLRDVGTDDDFGPTQPAGCRGKVDLLFLISSLGTMKTEQTQLLATFQASSPRSRRSLPTSTSRPARSRCAIRRCYWR